MANTPNQSQTSTSATGSKKPSNPLHGPYTPPASPMGRVPTPPGMAPRTGVKPGKPLSRKRAGTPWLTFSAFVLTMVWFGIVGFYVIKAGGFTSFLESSGAAAIIAVTGLMMAPAALFWMVFAYIKRASDIESAIEPLLRQLSLVTGQGGVAETRVRRFNDALTEQLSLLKETGVTSTKTAQKALETLTSERTALEQSQSGFATQIDALVATLRQHSGELESIVEGGQDQMNRIAIGAREVSAALADETVNAESKLTSLLETITDKFNASFVRLDKEQQENLQSYASISHEVTRTLRSEGVEVEGKLSQLLAAVTETLEEIHRVSTERLEAATDASAQIAEREKSLRAEAAVVSADIEDSAMAIVEATERFKELSTEGRSEAERLLAALNEQTGTLGKHTGDARIRLEATRDLIASAVGQLESAASRINTVGEDVSLSVDSRVAALGDAATALDATAHKITGQLDIQLSGYSDAQTRIETLYASVLERLRSESAALSDAATKLATDADSSVTRVRASTDEMAKAAGQQLDGYLSTVESAASKLGQQANENVARLRDAAAELTEAASQQFAGYTQAVESAAAKLDAQASASVTRIVGKAEELAQSATQQFDNYTQAVESAAAKLESQAAASASRIMGQTDEMALAAARQIDGYIAAIESATGKLDAQAASSANAIAGKAGELAQTASKQFDSYIDAVESAAAKFDAQATGSASRIAGQADDMAKAASQTLDGYIASIESAAAKLESQASASAARVEASIAELSKTTGQSLDSYSAIAGKADAQATMVADNFNNAIDRYAGTARQLNVAAAELQQLAARCDETIAEMGSTLTERAENLEQVGTRMASTSRSVKDDANVLTVTLQQLTDRLETVRAAASETSDQTVLRLTDIASVAGRNLSGIEQLAASTLTRLEAASDEISRQQGLIGQQVDVIQSNLGNVSDNLSSRIGGLLGDVERSSENATALINSFLSSAREIAPTLQQTASAATESALSATAAISAENERFGDRLVTEKTRWQALIDEQGRAFGDTLRELEGQMAQLRAVNADLDAGAQRATERLLAHNSAVVDLDGRLVASGRTQGEQLENVRGEIEKIVDYLQRQALALNAVTQAAIEGVRTATEAYGSEARGLGDLSRQTESQMVSATERMGEARAATAATREDVYALRTEIEQALEKLAAQTRQLEVTRAVTSETAMELSAQTGQASVQLSTLTSGLGEALERATLARASAFVQLDDVAGRVRGESETLEQTMARLSEKANAILGSIGSAGTEAGQQIETQLDATVAALRIQLDTIANEVTTLATSAAESAGNAAIVLRAQVAEQLASVEAQTEETLSAIGARADISAAQISSATRILTEAGYQSTEQFERALSQITATDATLGQLTEHAGSMRKQLIEESESTISALDRITADLTSQLGLLRSTSETGLESARGETETLQALLNQATMQLGASSLQLKDVSQTAGTYLAGLGQQLETQVALVRDTSNELANLSHDTASGENQLTERLGYLMGQITRARGDLATLDLQLAQQAASLSAQQQETLASLGQTLVSLEQTGSRIVATGVETLDSIQSVESRYQSIANTASQIAATHSADLDSIVARTAATMGELTEALQNASGEQSRQLAGQQEQLAALYGALRTESMASGESLTQLADRITAAGHATGTSAQQIIERLGSVAQSLIGEFTNVTDAAAEATGTLTGEANKLQVEASQIGLSARTAANDTGEAFATLRQQGLSVQAEMTTQLADTLGTLSAAQENYAALNGQLARQSQNAEDLLQTVGGKFESLLEVAQRTVTQLRQEMEGFSAATSNVLDQSGVDAFGERLTQLVADLSHGTGQALGDLRNVTAGLESARERTTQLARETEASLLEATATLEARHTQFATTAEQSAGRVAAAGESALSALSRKQGEFTASTMEAFGQIADTATATQQSLVAAAQQGSMQVASASEDVLAMLNKKQSELAAQTAQITSHVAAAGDFVSKTVADINDSITAGAQDALDQMAQSLSARQESLLAAAEARAETILSGFDRFKAQLDAQVGTLSQQLAGASDKAIDYAGRQSAAFAELGGSHATLRRETEAMLQTLTAAARRVTEASSDAQNDLSDVSNRLTGLRGVATTAIQGEIAELSQLIDGATSLINDLGHQLESQVSAVTDAGSALAHVSGSVNDNTAAALSRLQTLNQRLEAAKMSATLATEQAARRVSEILAQVDSDDLGEIEKAG